MIVDNLLTKILGANCFGGEWHRPKDFFYIKISFFNKSWNGFKLQGEKKTSKSNPRFSRAKPYFLNHILKDQKSPVVAKWNYEISYVIFLV